MEGLEPLLVITEAEFARLAKKHGLEFDGSDEEEGEEDEDAVKESPQKKLKRSTQYLVFNELLCQETQEALASAMNQGIWNRSAILTMENLKHSATTTHAPTHTSD